MVIWVAQQAWFMDYEDYLKLKAMDPGRAELEKNERMKNYQLNLVLEKIEEAKREYYENVEEDPDNKTIYLRTFREKIIQIPMIDKFDETKETYDNIKKQIEWLETIESQLDVVSSGVQTDEPDELGSEEPDVSVLPDPTSTEEVEESKNSEAIDERLEETPSVPEEETIESVRVAYKEATGKDVSNRYKNDVEWMKKNM